MANTIYALSSGKVPSGIAVIRVSGSQCRFVFETMCESKEFSRGMKFLAFKYPETRKIIDKGLVLTFCGPDSFTGEDVIEFHVHGGKAVVDAMLLALSEFEDVRLAEAGEFTYRAFENSKMDLTQAEGISDLILSETESQRILALENAEGNLLNLIDSWLSRLTQMRALLEAEIDFVEEEDIPGGVSDLAWREIADLRSEINLHIENIHKGEIVRNGFRVVLMGRPNAGKSSLLNAIAGRDVAIVTAEPGTTRDVLEVNINLGGELVIISDTAGIRESSNLVEQEGIKRAFDTAVRANMRIWLHALDEPLYEELDDQIPDMLLLTKADLVANKLIDPKEKNVGLQVSTKTGYGLDRLLEKIEIAAKRSIINKDKSVFGRERHRAALNETCKSLKLAENSSAEFLEIRSEYLRQASDCLSKIVGRVDVEDLLGEIFSNFCVGK